MRTHLDLFSGIGGFALAARWAGVETIGFAEIDDYACCVLAKNFPGVTNYGDVRNVPAVSAWLVTGGFPCQPFSVAGKRKGAADDRWLWPEMARVIAAVRPDWVLAENVPGIIKMELDTVLSDLERLDYTAWPIVIPAVGVDAPHRRERVWIVGYAGRSGQSRHDRRETGAQSTNGHADMADAKGTRLENGRQARKQAGTNEAIREMAFAGLERCGGAGWTVEPDVGRVAYGVPNRVDRLRGLGNAIVPQVAYNLIRMMIAADEVAEVAL